MTVSEQSSRKVILGAGWANPLTHAYVIENAAHVHVFADAVELVNGVDYTVTNVLNPAGYAVTITAPGSWAPTNWVLDARPPIDQAKDLTVGGTFGVKYEDGLDKLARRVERVWDLARRGLKTGLAVAVGDNPYTLPAPSADGIIGWNSAGTDLETKTPTVLGGALVDDDTTLSTNSSTRVPSQHAVKTYVDALRAYVDVFKAVFTVFGLSLMAATTYAEAWMVLKLNGSLSTRALIKALVPQAGMSVLLTESGRVGNFVWRTGDYSTQIAADTLEGMYLKAASVAANVGAWVRETDGMIRPGWWGAVGDNTTDDAAAIQAAINVAGDAFLSVGKTYRVTTTINLTAAKSRLGGYGTLRLDLGAGAAAKPAVYVDTTATEAVVRDITVDHGGSTYIAPTAHAANLIWGSAVFISANDAKAINITVKNAYDNGVAICQFSGATGTIVANSPFRAAAIGIQGFGNGCGDHGVTLGKQGACVDVASGTQCVVADCIDSGSAMGFILDVGAGAQATFSNCVSRGALVDVAHPAGGSGLGFYVGGADSAFVNCHAFYSGLHGWWIDAPANNNSYTNCEAYSCQKHGFKIDSGNSAFVACVARANSQIAANTWDGFALTHTTAKTGLVFHGCRGLDTQQRYGLAASPTGGGSIQGEIIGGTFEGTTGKVLLGSQVISVLYAGNNGNGKFAIGSVTPRAPLDVAGPDYSGTSIGDTTDLGQAFFGPLSQPNKRLAIGYGLTDDSGVIQAIHAGVATKLLKLNPTGSAVTVGSGGIQPEADDGAALGNAATKRWSDLFLATGAVLNYNNGNYTITHTAGNLSFSGSVDFTGAVLPTVSGTPSLGSGTKMWNSLFLASGGVVNFNNGNYTITHTAGILTFSAALLAGSTIGYASGIGAGGTVTQLTNRTTSVTLNKPSGQITTNNTSLAAGAAAKFTVNNSAVAALDTIVVSIASGTTTDQTRVRVQNVAAGGFNIVVENGHASTAETGAIVINYNLIKGSAN